MYPPGYKTGLMVFTPNIVGGVVLLKIEKTLQNKGILCRGMSQIWNILLKNLKNTIK